MRAPSSSNGGRSVADRAADLAIRDGDRRIRLKWHKLRRHADDPAFDRADSETIRSLRQTDESGVATEAAPLLLEELVGGPG